MKLGVIADDFTGASDIALTLAEAGMSVTQFIGVPNEPAEASLQAGVIALKSRTAPVNEAVADSLAACEWLLKQGVEQVVLKVCSTFDSTPKGNIGPVLEALAERLDAKHILTCPAFPENGRSVYQGHLFVNDVLLNESGMKDHPLTPMKDADLRRVLAAQTSWNLSHIPAQVVKRGSSAIREALPPSKAMTIVDAIHDEDLFTIGDAAKGQVLLCGGSGIALGLPRNFGVESATPRWVSLSGKGVVISGSCSAATREQVATFKASNPSFEVLAEDVINGVLSAEKIRDWVVEQTKIPIVYSSADPEVVKEAQQRFGTEVAAQAIEKLFAKLAKLLADSGVSRIVVAGGETSGSVVNGLEVKRLIIGPKIAPGVPMVRLPDRPLALALKSGNFGAADFFGRALALMEEGA